MGKTLLQFGFVLIACLPLASNASTRELVYPAPESLNDSRVHYHIELLHLLMSKMATPITLVESAYEAQQDRNLLLLDKGKIDIMWAGFSEERNEEYRMIPHKLSKGLLGHRVLLINSANPDLLKEVYSQEDLQLFSFGFGGGWPEVNLFSRNGFIVQTTTTYDGLFHMLARKRFDVLSRSVVEVWEELDKFESLPVQLDSHLVLKHDHGDYFFLRKNDADLAKKLEDSFEEIIESGEFDELFNTYFGKQLEAAQLNKRRMIELFN